MGEDPTSANPDVMFRPDYPSRVEKCLMILYQVKENAKWRRICTKEYNIPDSLA